MSGTPEGAIHSPKEQAVGLFIFGRCAMTTQQRKTVKEGYVRVALDHLLDTGVIDLNEYDVLRLNESAALEFLRDHYETK